MIKSAFGDFISLSFQLGKFFGRAPVSLALIAVVLVFAKPAPILPPPVPVWHRWPWFSLCFPHHALQIFMRASRLIVTPASYGYTIWYFTRSGTGSFQRDSARWKSWHRHRFRHHDRRASCPFSGAVRRYRLPGIVSLHSLCRMEGATLRPG